MVPSVCSVGNASRQAVFFWQQAYSVHVCSIGQTTPGFYEPQVPTSDRHPLCTIRHETCFGFANDKHHNTTPEVEAMLLKIYLALGVCSFEKQIRLLSNIRASIPGPFQRMLEFYTLINESPSNHPLWINPIEPNGVRIAITNGDYFVFDILKQLFGSMADGIISPVMHSPYHSQGASARVQDGELLEEIVLFSPVDVLEDIASPIRCEFYRCPFGFARDCCNVHFTVVYESYRQFVVHRNGCSYVFI